MKGKRMPRRKKLLLAGGIVLLVLAVLTGAFFWYVSDYYPADEIALEVLAQDSTIEVQDDLTILSPSYPTDTAVIFYPGAKVEQRPICPCWSRSGRPASPASWSTCPSAWRSLTRTRRKR